MFILDHLILNLLKEFISRLSIAGYPIGGIIILGIIANLIPDKKKVKK